MKRSYLTIIVAAGITTCSCSKDSKIFTEEDVAKLGNSSVEGSVQNRHGEALAGALVVLRPGGYTTVSGIDGKYTLSKLPAGRYAVEYLLPDYKDTIQVDSVILGLKDLQTNTPMQLRYRYAQIKGSVVSSTAEPAEGAGIIVEEQDIETQTVSGGKFSLRKIEPGHIRLFSVIQGVGYGYQEVNVVSDTVYENVQIALNQRGGAIQGSVIGADGKAVIGATVSSFDGAITTTTDADGHYNLTEMPKNGNMQVMVTKSGQQGVGNGINLRGSDSADIKPIRINPISDRDLAIIPTTIFGGDSQDSTTLLMHPVAADTAIKPLWFYWSFDNGKSWVSTYSKSTIIIPAKFGLGTGTHPIRMWSMTQDSITSDTVTSYLILTSGSANTTSEVNLDSLLALDSLSIWHSGMSTGRNVFGAQNELGIIRVNTRNIVTSVSLRYDIHDSIGEIFRADSLMAVSGTRMAYATTGWPQVCGSTWGFINNLFFLSQPTDSILKDMRASNTTDTNFTPAMRAAGQSAVDVSSFKGISITYTSNAPISIRMFQKNGTWNGYGWFNLDSSKAPRTVQLPFSSVVQGYSDGSTFTFDPAQLQDIQVLQRQEDACGYSDTTTMEILNIALIKTIKQPDTNSYNGPVSAEWSNNMNGNIWTATQSSKSGFGVLQTQTGGFLDIILPDPTNSSIFPADTTALAANITTNGFYADSVLFKENTYLIPVSLFYFLDTATSFDATAYTGACITYQTPDTTWEIHVQTKIPSKQGNWNNYRIRLPATKGAWQTYSFRWDDLWQDASQNDTYTTFAFDLSDLFNIQIMSRANASSYPYWPYIGIMQIGFNRSCD